MKSQSKTNPKPFVKWAGGKRNIINEILQRLPRKINNYYEAFVGGGALFYKLFDKVKCSYLSDLNIDLILAYMVIKNYPEKLIEHLKVHQKNHTETYYYQIRSLHSSTDPIENSARFIYLLKTCFNGLFRVNKKGKFNTPIGSYKNPLIADINNIKEVHTALQNVSIYYQDFSEISPRKDDFVYFDPPYHSINHSSFVEYTQNGFSETDQERLRDFSLELSKKGVNILISQSNTNFIYELYKKDFKIDKINAPRTINCKSDKRGSITELIIRNY